MKDGSTPVKIGDSEFDLTQVGDWVLAHPWLALAVVAIAYVFWISRKEGLLGAGLEYLSRKSELRAKVESDRMRLRETFRNRAISDSRESTGVHEEGDAE
jgi:hypothetical protein